MARHSGRLPDTEISKRTLQTYRTNGTLPFTRIENKMFYRPEDVEMVIRRSEPEPETNKSK
jgi:DNA-binding transcriptional MerR regulator